MALRMTEKERANFTRLFDDESGILIRETNVESKVIRLGHFIDIKLYHFVRGKHSLLAPKLEEQFRQHMKHAAPATD